MLGDDKIYDYTSKVGARFFVMMNLLVDGDIFGDGKVYGNVVIYL